MEDHLTAADGFLRSLYRFHAYYQIRRILEEIKAPLPHNQDWDAANNFYDREGFERICCEFRVSPHFIWKCRVHNPKIPRYDPPDVGPYDPDAPRLKKILALRGNYVTQDTPGADTAWKKFILNMSYGFTRPGVERLNDSIRTFVWAILGAQGQTRTDILGDETAFDAQKQFLANFEDVISAPVDLPASIDRYQESLQYARSEVNYSFGKGLYMAPSDMLLRIGKIAGYNNLIIIATDAQSLGLNSDLNKDIIPPDAANDTGEKGLVIPIGADSEATTSQTAAKPTPATTTAAEKADHEAHEDEKTALIVGSIAIGLGLLWFLR